MTEDEGQRRDAWRAELAALREEASHYYEHQFDWRGHLPPADYRGPRFYAASERWRLTARLDTTVPGAGERVRLATSTGQLRPMTVAGQLVFKLDGREHRLTAFLTHGAEHELFVPFRDATSGGETYGAGRYLDLPFAGADADYLLDFNLAYNPACAYSPAYDCPYPSSENRLEVAVEAGERLPFEHG